MSDDLQDKLTVVRAEIDAIDAQLLDLLNRRAQCAQRVGQIKMQHGDAGFIYRPEREAQVLRRIQEINPGPLSGDSVTWFFREVMSACLSLERPLAIAFLGPLGTFSESAATNSERTCCPSPNFMPRTPRAVRPIGRTSSSSNQTALPASETSTMSCVPLVISAPIR